MDRPIGELTAPDASDDTDHEAGVWSTGLVTERLVATAAPCERADARCVSAFGIGVEVPHVGVPRASAERGA